jgi:hypothetical protein
MEGTSNIHHRAASYTPGPEAGTPASKAAMPQRQAGQPWRVPATFTTDRAASYTTGLVMPGSGVNHIIQAGWLAGWILDTLCACCQHYLPRVHRPTEMRCRHALQRSHQQLPLSALAPPNGRTCYACLSALRLPPAAIYPCLHDTSLTSTSPVEMHACFAAQPAACRWQLHPCSLKAGPCASPQPTPPGGRGRYQGHPPAGCGLAIHQALDLVPAQPRRCAVQPRPALGMRLWWVHSWSLCPTEV